MFPPSPASVYVLLFPPPSESLLLKGGVPQPSKLSSAGRSGTTVPLPPSLPKETPPPALDVVPVLEHVPRHDELRRSTAMASLGVAGAWRGCGSVLRSGSRAPRLVTCLRAAARVAGFPASRGASRQARSPATARPYTSRAVRRATRRSTAILSTLPD